MPRVSFRLSVVETKPVEGRSKGAPLGNVLASFVASRRFEWGRVTAALSVKTRPREALLCCRADFGSEAQARRSKRFLAVLVASKASWKQIVHEGVQCQLGKAGLLSLES